MVTVKQAGKKKKEKLRSGETKRGQFQDISGTTDPNERIQKVNEARARRGLESISPAELPENREAAVKRQAEQVQAPLEVAQPEEVAQPIFARAEGREGDPTAFQQLDEAFRSNEAIQENPLVQGAGAVGGAIQDFASGGFADPEDPITSAAVSTAALPILKGGINPASIGAPSVGVGGKQNFQQLSGSPLNFANNLKNQRLTGDLLTRFTNPKNAGIIMSAIGSYPFAGFIKEEALQTLGFAVLSAKQSGDLESERIALEEQAELLNPSTWQQIIGAVPYANVLSELRNFYDAARTKYNADVRSFEKRSEGLNS